MLSEEYDYLYKIVLVGDAGVGKTHILCQYIMGTSPLSSAPTVGVEFATRNITLPAGGTVKA
jgi:Rab family protein